MKEYLLKDFSFPGKKVYYEGICLSKFDLGQILDSLRPNLGWSFLYDDFTYGELVSYLRSRL